MKPRRFTMDLALDNTVPPMPDDLLIGPNIVYRVTESRPVDSRIWGNRWKLTVHRIADKRDEQAMLAVQAELANGVRSHTYSSYRRGETPAEFFGTLWPPIDTTHDQVA